MPKLNQSVFYILIFSCFYSCKKQKDTLFTLQNNSRIGIDFANNLTDTKDANVFSYRNYYNGGGVAIGDVNNDGLNDVFLTSNQGDNKLFINKGNWKFEDVTEKAGVKGSKYWSTGVTLVDVNADGWLDIYVCNGGNAQGVEAENELFINRKDGTFEEQAKEFGLADPGLSTQAVFFDYDLDGDLDCYVLNNSFRPIESFDFSKNLRSVVDEIGGDRLYRNDEGRFKNVTSESGIYSSDIGFGLGVSVADLNSDGYPDLYVSNDFFEHDYLYINQKDGTFKQELENAVGHVSLASMGSDIADLNNDGKYDIFTTEMLPEGDRRLKLVTAFESYDVSALKQRDGYYNQYMQNCLQLNNGDGTFSEIAFYAGVAATDWSWGALAFDMDNDGWRDLFVSNGIYKDLTDQDFIEFLGNEDNVRGILEGRNFNYKKFTDEMKSTPVSNYAFRNNRNLTFSNQAVDFGLDKPSFSNGAAYGDLDNDGDDDLIVNNVNMPVFVYKNNSDKSGNRFVQVKLEGSESNKFGVGATVTAYVKNTPLSFYHQPARGFQSCVAPNLITIGVGGAEVLDSLKVFWPSGKCQVLTNVKTNALYSLKDANARKEASPTGRKQDLLFENVTPSLFDTIPKHREDNFIDFDRERLMLQMMSTENPYLETGDINNDGLTDFFFGASKGSVATIYIQEKNGKFRPYIPDEFKKQIYMETAAAVFGDFDSDGDEDLILTVGGNEEENGSNIFYPRFFENDGKGNLKRNFDKTIKISVNASVIAKCDYDKDGDEDIFIGGRSIPGLYGCAAPSYLLQNDGKGNFKDVSKTVFGSDNKWGMVTSAKWADIDKNGFDDLLVAGNWMGIKIFKNLNGKFKSDDQLDNFRGWWSSLAVEDVDGDGHLDIIAGNLGLNSKFRASKEMPMRIYIKDFDNNGIKECVTSMYKKDGQAYPFHMRPDLVGQMPMFKKRFLHYKDYAGKPFSEIFDEEMLAGAETHEINFLSSAVFLNNGKGRFSCKPFPYQAQLAPVNTIICEDLDRNGTKEVILAGNSYAIKPEVGRLDAGYGGIYELTSSGFTYTSPQLSGMMLKGQVRSSAIIKDAKGRKYLLFGRNNDQMEVFRIK